MCLIVVDPQKTTPEPIPFEIIESGMKANPDLSGFMFSNGNRLIVRKPYGDPTKLYKKYLEDYKNNNRTPFVFHFRAATSGQINTKNTHPIKINKNLALVHNGIFSTGDMLHSKVSDTFLFVKSLLANNITNMDSIPDSLGNTVGSNRIVFMDNSGKIKIVNESIGDWVLGRWYSTTCPAPRVNSGYGVLDDGNWGCDICKKDAPSLAFVEVGEKQSQWLCRTCRTEQCPVCSQCNKLTTSTILTSTGNPICRYCWGRKDRGLKRPNTITCKKCLEKSTSWADYKINDETVCVTCYNRSKTQEKKECPGCKTFVYYLRDGLCTPCFKNQTQITCSFCDTNVYLLEFLGNDKYTCVNCAEKGENS